MEELLSLNTCENVEIYRLETRFLESFETIFYIQTDSAKLLQVYNFHFGFAFLT